MHSKSLVANFRTEPSGFLLLLRMSFIDDEQLLQKTGPSRPETFFNIKEFSLVQCMH